MIRLCGHTDLIALRPTTSSLFEETVSALEGHRDFLRFIISSGGTIELFCGIMLSTNWDEVFPHTLSASLAALGIDLRLDAYPEDHAQA